MSNKIWFDPTSDKWVLSDGGHYLEVPYWARGIIADESERETEPLKTENAWLRERLYEAHMSRLLTENENETLRELVRELLTDPDAWDYDYFKYRMYELGIEVD